MCSLIASLCRPNDAIFSYTFPEKKIVYNNCHISISCSNLKQLNITIVGNKDFPFILQLFVDILELLFLNNGYYYEISSFEVDGVSKSFDDFFDLDYIHTSVNYIRGNKLIPDIDIIDNSVIKNYRRMKESFHRGLHAFSYLKSIRYEKVLFDHKFCILSQICEGFVETSSLESQLTKTNFENRIRLYFAFYNEINKKRHFSIYSVFGSRESTIIEKIKNSRHMLSHYVNKKKIFHHDEYSYIFYFLELLLRMRILDYLGIHRSSFSPEPMFFVHDFIMINREIPNFVIKLKSIDYKKMYMIKEINS